MSRPRPQRPTWLLAKAIVRSRWRQGLGWALVFTMLLVVGALAFAGLGLAPIAASSGHWQATQRFLGFAMRNAVETRSMPLAAPSLTDPQLLVKSAGHFATGCAPCHGAPGQPRSPLILQMVPQAPVLAPRLEHWTPEQLFWIVRHGLKYTAMPGWVSQHRDDEVWAMVAFLRRMPQMAPAEYRSLAYGEVAASWFGADAAAGRSEPEGAAPAPPAEAALAGAPTAGASIAQLVHPPASRLDDCARCHGRDGRGRGGTIPVLAGQDEEYLLASLVAFAAGERESGIMQPVAAALDADTMRLLARWYALQGPAEGLAARQRAGIADRSILIGPDGKTHVLDRGDERLLAHGQRLALHGDGPRKIPACAQCHGPGPAHPRQPPYPRLAGQHAEYLALQLRLFKAGHRGGSPWHHLMEEAVEFLEPRDMDALSVWYEAAPERTP